MNQDELKGKWRQLQGEIKTRWARLTDDDMGFIEGNFDKLVGRIQERYGWARDQAQKDVDDFLMQQPTLR